MTETKFEENCETLPVWFLFNCTKKHVNLPIPLSAAEAKKLPAWCENADHIFLKCKTCDQMMIYSGFSNDNLDGLWACPECERTVREVTPYRILDKLNREFEAELFIDA